MMTTNKNFLEAAQLDADYARVFDETNRNWERKPEYNLLFLRSMENWTNDLLHARGYVFLNDVYDRLGFDRTPAGQIVGWFMNSEGTTRVDFGIQDRQNEVGPKVLLEFNVDGIIYDKI
ncbi:hypothetical protein PP914_gp093 [Arthrobacter phage Qui]|jgi:hypothetical protein|uniref:Uncharacterized protein n=1 Tax=Arthrobacter phage Qui TaxID=2603260 RepID=A0A5B8WGG3_9CAUD|nr:hypothetical protein PP914_gp093 [Arthrobacter phage Qui]QED11583.1 hypothetical protein SEA_QUI_93 [Arthrobacter phage Qui]QOC56415.1 hypothetical protein SEA_PAELLA_93 [Arthrobacter phage Paella]